MRERLDVKRNAREHFWPVASVVSLCCCSDTAWPIF
jgi:hypothetical protein